MSSPPVSLPVETEGVSSRNQCGSFWGDKIGVGYGKRASRIRTSQDMSNTNFESTILGLRHRRLTSSGRNRDVHSCIKIFCKNKELEVGQKDHPPPTVARLAHRGAHNSGWRVGGEKILPRPYRPFLHFSRC